MIETALAIGLWAVSFVFIKVALREISPVTLIVTRYSMGMLILGGVAARRGDFARLRRADLPGMIWLGAVGVALHQLLQVSGQATADASVAAFLASTAPAFLVLLSALLLREQPSRSQTCGVLLATAGAAVVSTGGDLAFLSGGRLANTGNLLVLLSAVVWALYSILNRSVVQGRPPALITTGMMFFGWAFVLPLFVLQRGWQELARVSPAGWGALLYVGVLSTALAYLLYTDALEKAPAARLAAIQNIEPAIAFAAAALILGEPLTPALLVGGAAILAGVWLAERRGGEEEMGSGRVRLENSRGMNAEEEI